MRKRLPSSLWIVGAVTISPLPFSNRISAIRLPMLSRVVSRNARAPLASTLRLMSGRWFSSKPGCASLRLSPEKMTCFLTSSGTPLRSMKRSSPNGTVAGGRGGLRLGRVVDEARFERRRAADDVLRLRRVLHAGQLDDDAIGALLLDDGLRHAELVDAVVQGADVLLQRVVLDRLDRRGPERGDESRGGTVPDRRDLHVRHAVLEDRTGPARGVGVGERHLDRIAGAHDAVVADVLVAQQRARVAGQRVEALGQRALHVDLHQEVHAAAQVETEVHRQRVDRGQPARRVRHEVERDDVARVVRGRVQPLLQDVLGLQLRIAVREPHADRWRLAVVEEHAGAGDAGLLQQRVGARHHRRVHLDRGLAAGDLHGRRVAEDVGQRVDQADRERDDDDDVLPERITIHGAVAGRGSGARERVRSP